MKGVISLRDDEVYHRGSHLGFSAEFMRVLSRTTRLRPAAARATGRALLEARDGPHPRCARRSGIPWLSLPGRRRLPHHSRCPARSARDMPIGVISLTRAEVRPFTDKQIELVDDLRRPGGDRDRECSPVRGGAGAHARAAPPPWSSKRLLPRFSRSSAVRRLTCRLCSIPSCSRRPGCARRTWYHHSPEGGEYFFREAFYGLPPEFVEYVRDHSSRAGARITSPVEPCSKARAFRLRMWIGIQNIAGIRRSGSAISARLLGVPLMREGTPVGVISLGRRAVGPSPTKQIELVTTFADQAVIAIENVRLFEEVQARTRELQEVARAADCHHRRAQGHQPLALRPSAGARHDRRNRRAALRSRSGDCGSARTARRYRSAAHHGYSPEFAELPRATSHCRRARHAVGRGPRRRDGSHPRRSRRSGVHVIEAQRLGGYRAMLGVPLLREGKPIGVICCCAAEPRPFTDKQIELVTTFADQAVIAIENVRLFEEVQARTRELQEALEQQTATSEVLQVISSSTGDLAAGLRDHVGKRHALCDAKFGIMSQIRRWRSFTITSPSRCATCFCRKSACRARGCRSRNGAGQNRCTKQTVAHSGYAGRARPISKAIRSGAPRLISAALGRS